MGLEKKRTILANGMWVFSRRALCLLSKLKPSLLVLQWRVVAEQTPAYTATSRHSPPTTPSYTFIEDHGARK
jgi:hypothetical protein